MSNSSVTNVNQPPPPPIDGVSAVGLVHITKFSYIDLQNSENWYGIFDEPKTIGNIIDNRLHASIEERFGHDETEYQGALESLAYMRENFADWKVISYTDNDENPDGFCATALESPTGDIVVAVRGSERMDVKDENVDWYHNILGLSQVKPNPEAEMERFFDSFYDDLATASKNGNKIVLAGHSLGGNTSNRAAIYLDEKQPGLVDKCYSIEGQGFNYDYIAKHKASIDALEARGALVNIQNENDIVPALLISIGGVYYVKDASAKDANFFAPHMLENLARTSDGNLQLNETGKAGELPRMITKLTGSLAFQPLENREALAKFAAEAFLVAMDGEKLGKISGAVTAMRDAATLTFFSMMIDASNLVNHNERGAYGVAALIYLSEMGSDVKAATIDWLAPILDTSPKQISLAISTVINGLRFHRVYGLGRSIAMDRITGGGNYELKVTPQDFDQVVQKLFTIKTEIDDLRQEIENAAATLLENWRGEAAGQYEEYVGKLSENILFDIEKLHSIAADLQDAKETYAFQDATVAGSIGATD